MELETQTPLPRNSGFDSEPIETPVNPNPSLETRTGTLGDDGQESSFDTPDDPAIGVETALDLYEQQLAAPQNGEASEASTDAAPDSSETPIDWDSERVRKLSESFKDVLGVDLRETHNMVQQLREQYSAIQERQAEQALQAQLSSLQDSWGVNEAELNRRVNAVVEYASKLPEALRAQVDNPEGFKLIWSRIEQAKSTPVSAKTSGKSETSPQYKFRKSELAEMMMTRPEEYSARQAEIAAAYAKGQVLNDR